MPFYDKNGTRILSQFEPKSDVILPDNSAEELVSVQKSIQQNTEKMASEIAKQNGSCTRNLLFEAVKALVVAITTLAVEHIFDLWRFVEPLFHIVPPISVVDVLPMVLIGLAAAFQTACI